MKVTTSKETTIRDNDDERRWKAHHRQLNDNCEREGRIAVVLLRVGITCTFLFGLSKICEMVEKGLQKKEEKDDSLWAVKSPICYTDIW